MTEKRLEKYQSLKIELDNLKLKLNKSKKRSKEIVCDAVCSAAEFPYSKHTVVVKGLDANEQDKALTYDSMVTELYTKSQRELLELQEYIQDIESPEIRTIMTMKYIDGETWQWIAYKFGWSDEGTPRKKIKKYLEHSENSDSDVL